MRLSQGAEATIERTSAGVQKIRLPKPYRLQAIDDRLRRSRTRREAKILQKLPIPGSQFLSVDDTSMVIEMSFLPGKKARDVLNARNAHLLCCEIGKMLVKLHDASIIHGDLTTSNIIVSASGHLSFIDFGLSFFSSKIEDKATDLHLLKESLESKHASFWEEAWEGAFLGYLSSSKEAALIKEKLAVVDLRGRYKHKN